MPRAKALSCTFWEQARCSWNFTSAPHIWCARLFLDPGSKPLQLVSCPCWWPWLLCMSFVVLIPILQPYQPVTWSMEQPSWHQTKRIFNFIKHMQTTLTEDKRYGACLEMQICINGRSLYQTMESYNKTEVCEIMYRLWNNVTYIMSDEIIFWNHHNDIKWDLCYPLSLKWFQHISTVTLRYGREISASRFVQRAATNQSMLIDSYISIPVIIHESLLPSSPGFSSYLSL